MIEVDGDWLRSQADPIEVQRFKAVESSPASGPLAKKRGVPTEELRGPTRATLALPKPK